LQPAESLDQIVASKAKSEPGKVREAPQVLGRAGAELGHGLKLALWVPAAPDDCAQTGRLG
jgi:hypothetical protein